MSIFNLGSINVDHFYQVPHLPTPGETLAATGFTTGLGGKGANQSVAATRAGAHVTHIGAVGADGDRALAQLRAYNVDTTAIRQVDAPTAHAIINVDQAGENAIVIYPGANVKQSRSAVSETLSSAKSGDILLLQNETNLQAETAEKARSLGLFVIYSAAPFDAQAVRAMLPHTDLLVMNEGEYASLTAALEPDLLPDLLITKGADGSAWKSDNGDTEMPAFSVTPVDTTGAGDCFIGTLAAGLDQGLARKDAMRLAAAAAALQVTRPGTASAIPTRAEVDAFLKEHT